MTEQTRAHLTQEFQDGERPSGADFADLIDSFLNMQDDGLSIDSTDSTLVLARGLRLGDSADAQVGTLRFNGGQPEYHDGTNFVPIGGSGGAGAFQPVGGGADVAYTGGGTVGIGNFPTPAAYRLDVELATNTATTEQVRLGFAAIHRGTSGTEAGSAYFSHMNHASDSSFALRQRATGEVSINSRTGAPIMFSQGGTPATTRMTISPNGRILMGTPIELPANATLHVSGNAAKNTPGTAWISTSDERVKEKVTDYKAGLEQVLAIRPVKFRYNGKAGTMRGAEGVGVLAQEIESVLPESVSHVTATIDNKEVDDLCVYDGNSLQYVLVNAIKELAAKVEALEKKVGRRR